MIFLLIVAMVNVKVKVKEVKRVKVTRVH